MDGRYAGSFATTQWALIRQVGDSAEPLRQQALAELAELYWYPLYAFLRRSQYRAEDAADLVQGLFLQLMQGKSLVEVEETGGRFRNWIITALKNHAANVRRAAGAAKRGGEHQTFSLDLSAGEGRFQGSRAAVDQPERVFDQDWALTVIAAAKLQLAEELAKQGKSLMHEQLAAYLVQPLSAAVLHEKAARLGLARNSVEVALYRLRRRFGQMLRGQVAATLTAADDIDAEISELMKALQGS